MRDRPTILWIADQPQWAYDAIIMGVAPLLPQYAHTIFYACTTLDPNHERLNLMARGADVIVSMYLRYVEFLRPEHKGKVATMITGNRPFES